MEDSQGNVPSLNIFFDMDYTLLGMDGGLRPGAREIMQRLKADGHTLYVWSGTGIRWTEVRQHKLDPYVTDCFVKPLNSFVEARERLDLPVRPDLVIDDYPEVPAALGGIWVRPYLFDNDNDDEMERVYQMISQRPLTALLAHQSRDL
ncbi:MAG: HAD family hydrolase [Chloroflexi bacterium]|nr:HAD family hydrolase [Chloroflexota bacterium]